MKKILVALLVLFTSSAYATEQDILNFYVENGTEIAADHELFTVPPGKTLVIDTIYAFSLNSSSVFMKRDDETLLRFHPANDNLLNFNTGLSFPSGSKVSVNFRSNYLTISGYLQSNAIE